jgi:hypothetical protein
MGAVVRLHEPEQRHPDRPSVLRGDRRGEWKRPRMPVSSRELATKTNPKRYGGETPADQDHRSARYEGVHRCRDHEEAGYINAKSAYGEVECSPDGPQNYDESCGREQSRGHAGYQVDRRFSCDPDIVSDSVFRVLMVAAHQIELIITAGCKSTFDETIGKPPPRVPVVD